MDFNSLMQLLQPEYLAEFWWLWLLIFALVTTFILKKSGKAQTFHLVSVLKTKKFLPILERFKKHKRFLNWFADIGLILGFGAVAIDYKFGKGKRLWQRVILFLISMAAMYFVLEGLSIIFPLFKVFFTNPFIREYNWLMKAGFMVFGLSGLMLAVLAAYAIFVVQSTLAGKQVCPGVAPILPGIAIPKVPFVVPIHAWLSFLIILVIHEGMHGVLMRKIGTKIKSTGLLLFGLLPIGAFVEPDEEDLAKQEEIEQLRVYSAGPSANLYTSLGITILLTFFILLIANPLWAEWVQEVKINSIDAVFVDEVNESIELCGQEYDNPAFGTLKPGMQIKKIGRIGIISGEGVSTAMSIAVSEYDRTPVKMELVDEQGQDLNLAIVPNELGIISFSVREEMNPNYTISEEYKTFSFLSGFLSSFLFWLILLNFFIAIGNFLPLDPLDGGKITKILLRPYFGFMKMNKEDTEKLIGRLTLWTVGILLLINILPMFL